MRRAIELGWRGIGRNSPNPLVGCVIVRAGEIVGEGFHLFARIDHAEVIALKAAGEKAKGATAYVSVEPCCHTGRTPPCCTALAEAGIARVVYGMRDPDPRVNGGGHMAIEAAGIEVIGGVLEDEVRDQNRFFVTVHEKGRPYVLLKWAMTLDGKIATRTGASKWISSESSRNIAHHLRNIFDAVLVGHVTVLTDDPQLSCRVDLSRPLPREIFPSAPTDVRHPTRVIVDAFSSTFTEDHKVFQQPGRTIVAVAPQTDWEDSSARHAVERDKVELIECPLTGGHIDLFHLLRELKNRGVNSVLVEGGGGIHAAFLEKGLADEVAAFVAPKIFAGDSAPSPVAGAGIEAVADAWNLTDVRHISIENIENDVLVMGRILKRPEDTEPSGQEGAD